MKPFEAWIIFPEFLRASSIFRPNFIGNTGIGMYDLGVKRSR